MNLKPMRSLLPAYLIFMAIVGHENVIAADTELSPPSTNAIERVEASAISGQTLVKITLREGIAALPSSFTISTPPRIAIDLPNTENLTGGSVTKLSLGDLQSINIVQAGTRTRLVLNLNHPSRYDTKLEGKVIYISLGAPNASQTPSATVGGSKTQSASSAVISLSDGNSIQNVDFRAESVDLAKIKIDLMEPNPLIDVKRQGASLVLSLQNVKLPDRLARKLDVRDFGTPVLAATTSSSGQGTQLVISNRGEWDYNVTQMDTTVKIEIRRIVANSKSLIGAKELQGKTVSFNFTQPVPVSQMIGIFQDITGLNFMLMPGVTGEIERLKMENTPVETAIDVVSRMYGLSMRRFGDLVVIGKAADLAKYEKDEKDLQAARIDAEPIEQESIKVRFRPAAEIVAALTGTLTSTSASGGGNAQIQNANPAPGAPASGGAASNTNTALKSLISSRGSISYDSVTNMIFVEETRTQIEKIRERMESLDRPVRQVMIEARIVSVAKSFSKALGSKLGFTATGTQKLGSLGGHAVDIGGPLNFNSSQSVAATSTLSFSLFNPSQTRLLTLELTADEQDGSSKNIASPKILTQDGRQATVADGSTIFFQLSGGTSGPTTVSIDASTKLDVTPQIGADGKIQMKVYVNKGGVGPVVSGNPTVTKQEITTNVVVENGGTLMLGGVFTSQESDSTGRVPLLGDIPYVGWLFKQNTKTQNKSELLIFLTPRIVTEELTLQ